MVDNAEYKVVGKASGYELRVYPPTLLATVDGLDDGESFGILFSYIAGDNQSRMKIPMTAPVVSSERIEMTAPVISGPRFFTFVMPKTYSIEALPIPKDSRVRIHIQPEKKFAVARFSGRTGRRLVEEESKALMACTSRDGLKTRGPVFLMRYNSPFTPGFLRRNEVAIEVV